MRILVADDEPLARERLVQLLQELGDPFELAGTVGDGQAVIDFLSRHPVDVVLMDIRMPGLDGLSAAGRIALQPAAPAIVFTTAYSEYALQAFDANAVDYLLKPIRRDRLAKALGKARQLSAAQLDVLQENPLFLHASNRGALLRIPLSEISYLRADNKYVVVRHDAGEALLEESLKSLEERFPGQFFRIHRNALVVLERVTGMEKMDDGRWVVSFRDLKEQLEISRRHLPELRRKIKQHVSEQGR